METRHPENPTQTPFYVTGGTLPRNAASYVTRSADDALLSALMAGEFCYILTARQMGKSSLMVRTATRLREADVSVAVIDLTAFGTNLSPEQWYDRIANRIGRELDCEEAIDDFYSENARLSPLNRFVAALETIVLKQTSGRLVLFVDEIDVVRSLPFSADEFFAAIRELYNRRADDSNLARLTFGLFGVASPSDLIKDARITPFNIGKRIELRDFTRQDAEVLASGLGANGNSLLDRIFHWTNGHPYLTQRLCATAETQNSQIAEDIDKIVSALFLETHARDSEDNLKFVSDRLLRATDDTDTVLARYAEIVKGKRVPDDDTDPITDVLRLSGIVKSENGTLKVRNRIYETVFDTKWIRKQTTPAELRRQQDAYRKGFLRSVVFSGILGAVFSALALFAFVQANTAKKKAEDERIARVQADRNAERANKTLYIAKMNLVQAAYEEDNIARVRELLNDVPKGNHQMFEWGYWKRLCHVDSMTLKGHTGAIFALAVSPDGKSIVTGSGDQTAKVWDVTTGKERYTLGKQSEGVISVAFSPDGKLFFTGDKFFYTAKWNGTVKLWNAATGKEIRTLFKPDKQVAYVVFSSDGKQIVIAGKDKTAKIYDIATGKFLLTLKGQTQPVIAAAFSPDGKFLVTEYGNGTAKVWDTATGRERQTLIRHTPEYTNIAFSPDSRRFVTKGDNNTAQVWDMRTGKLLLTLTGHSAQVLTIAYSPDGKSIATGSYDQTVKVWDAKTGKAKKTFRGHTDFIYAVAFFPDSKRIVSGSEDKTAQIWDSTARDESPLLMDYTQLWFSVAYSPDGNFLVTGSADKTVRIREAATGKTLRTLKGHSESVSAVAFSPDSRHIATASNDKTVKIWDVKTGEGLLTLKGHTSQVASVAYSPDGKRLVTASWDDGTIRIWDAATGKERDRFKKPLYWIPRVVFSPDGKQIASVGNDATAKIWDAATGKDLATLKGHTVGVPSVAYSHDGKFLVTASWDKTAKIWDAATGRELHTLKGHRMYLTCAAFSHDGRHIVTGCFDKTAKVWDTESGELLLTLKGHNDAVISAVFSPDDKRIVTKSRDGTARIWISDPDAK